MIELTEELRQAVHAHPGEPLRLIDPATSEAFIPLQADEYDRLTEGTYDDSPWSDEEMDLLAAEDVDCLGWEGMDVYQDQEPEP